MRAKANRGVAPQKRRMQALGAASASESESGPALGSKSSCPTRVAQTAENTGYSDGDDENTTESTTCANFYAKCIKQYLEAGEIQALMEQLVAVSS